MRISVVIAARNGAATLGQAIESIRTQHRLPDEIVAVDGHSTDSTAEVVRAYPEVRYLPQQSTGVGGAWNEGIEETTGELVAFLSHDDRWLPGKLALQAGLMERERDLAYTITRFRFVLEGECPPGFRPALLEGDHVGRIMETLMASRSTLDRVGGFAEDLRASEDVDWFARANSLRLPSAVVEEVLLEKRVSGDGLTLTSGYGGLFSALRRAAVRNRGKQAAP